MSEPSDLEVVGILCAMLGMLGGSTYVMYRLLRIGDEGAEEAPRLPEPAPPPEDWRLSQATRNALMDLGYALNLKRHDTWAKPYPDRATDEHALIYELAARDTKLQAVYFESDDAPAALPLDGLHLRVRVRREGLTVDDPSWVVADTDATADLLIEARQFGTRGVSGSDPLAAEDAARCLAFLDADLLAQVRAIPQASLELDYEALERFSLKVEWPMLDESSGPRVVAATQLVILLDEKLRAPRAA